jgi:hypothetical protein
VPREDEHESIGFSSVPSSNHPRSNEALREEEKPDAVTDYVEESHVDCSIKPRAFSRRITSSEREKQIIC